MILSNILVKYKEYHVQLAHVINTKKTGLFEGSFLWEGGQFAPLFAFKGELI